jgi:hypothetical protein
MLSIVIVLLAMREKDILNSSTTLGVNGGDSSSAKWAIICICGLCVITASLLGYYLLEIYKTCCRSDHGVHYTPIQ